MRKYNARIEKLANNTAGERKPLLLDQINEAEFVSASGDHYTITDVLNQAKNRVVIIDDVPNTGENND